jgi:hypothetical protein
MQALRILSWPRRWTKVSLQSLCHLHMSTSIYPCESQRHVALPSTATTWFSYPLMDCICKNQPCLDRCSHNRRDRSMGVSQTSDEIIGTWCGGLVCASYIPGLCGMSTIYVGSISIRTTRWVRGSTKAFPAQRIFL